MKVVLELDGERRELEADLAAGVLRWGKRSWPFRVIAQNPEGATVEVAGETVVVAGWPAGEPTPSRPVSVAGERVTISVRTEAGMEGARPAGPTTPAPRADPSTTSANAIYPPMPGRVIEVRVREGERVEKGTLLLVLEAMKMRNEIVAPRTGVVRHLSVRAGDSVRAREMMLSLDPE